MESCIYSGNIRHRRHTGRGHAFTYPIFMMYLDLDELPGLFAKRCLWSAARPALAWFRREDHCGDPAQPLAESIRELVASRLGVRPDGPIRVLTHLRYFGYCFNPVSFYFCFDAAGTRPEYLVLEVNNTPWREQHTYVLRCGSDAKGAGSFKSEFDKAFHVSPFLGMDLRYACQFRQPGERFVMHMENLEGTQRVFDATLRLRRRAITGASLAWTLFRFPFMTQAIVARIYWQAFRLWIKRAPLHAHP